MDELTEEDRESWQRLGTAPISDCTERFGVLSSRVRRLSGDGVLGRAFCVRVMPGDSASLHLALDHVPPNRILVVDAGGFPDRAVWGEVLTVAAQRRRVQGLVVDGAVRDIAAIRRRAFPVYGVGTSPAGPHKSSGGAWGGSVACGGAVVHTGDLIVGDEDGVVAVAWERRADVLAAVRKRTALEGRWLSELEKGRRSAELLGL